MKRQRLCAHYLIRNSRGFTIFEIILAIIILVIAIIPMVNAFAPALFSAGQAEEQAVLTGRTRQTLNRLLDLDFKTLDTNRGKPANLTTLLGSAEEAAKENLDYLGQTYIPVVNICAVDAGGIPVPDCVTNASDGTVGLLELKVSLKNISLQTLKAEH